MALNNSVRAAVPKPTPDMLPTVDPDRLPKLFGHNWKDPAFRKDHSKQQALLSESYGRDCAKTRTQRMLPYEDAPGSATASAARLRTELDTTVASTHGVGMLDKGADATAASAKFSVDDKALRFFAYFDEEVRESAAERHRRRKVTITYFPVDDTILIQEPRVANSGLGGGVLLKRQRVPLSPAAARARAIRAGGDDRLADRDGVTGKWTSINDIVVGSPLVMYAHEYVVYGCDAYTREFLTELLGMDVAPDAPHPDDAYVTEYRATRIDGKVKEKSFETRDLAITMESLAAGGKSGGRYPDDHVRAQRFIADSGKVLRFYGYWMDYEADPKGALRTFDVQYFIEDDTLSIIERTNPTMKNESVSSGFLSRRRLPKDPRKATKSTELTFAGRINGQMEAYLGDDAYYVATDLGIGRSITVFGRDVTLYACDGYTRAHFADNLGINLAPDQSITHLFPPKPERKVLIPPPTGYGSPEDSRASCGSLVLKPPRKDTTNWLKHAGEVLRFRLRMYEPERKEDLLRVFILNFYVEDGEIMVSEAPVRNSGFTGGKFIKKQKLHKKPGEDPDCYFTLKDLTIGAVVTITGFRFIIEEADEHSHKFMQYEETAGRHPDELTKAEPARVRQLLKTFVDFIVCRYPTHTEAFRAFDKDHDGFVSLKEMREVLSANQITHRPEESVALIQVFDREGDGRICYKDFMAAVSSVHTAPDAPLPLADASAKCAATSDVSERNALRRRLMKQLKERLEARCLNGFEMFRLFSTQPRAFRGKQQVELAALTNGA